MRWARADAFVVEREEVAGVLRGLELGGERGVGVVKDGEAAGFGAGRRRRRLVGGSGTLGFSSLDDVGVGCGVRGVFEGLGGVEDLESAELFVVAPDAFLECRRADEGR